MECAPARHPAKRCLISCLRIPFGIGALTTTRFRSARAPSPIDEHRNHPQLAANVTGARRTPARGWINILRRIGRSTTPGFVSNLQLQLPLFDFDLFDRANFKTRWGLWRKPCFGAVGQKCLRNSVAFRGLPTQSSQVSFLSRRSFLGLCWKLKCPQAAGANCCHLKSPPVPRSIVCFGCPRLQIN